QNPLLWTRAEVLIQQDGKHAEAKQAIARLRATDYYPADIDYLDARLLIRDRQWSEAARTLERVRTLPDASPSMAKQVDLLLGQCYEMLGEPDRQFDTYQRMLAADPSSPVARYGKASALSAMGRLDEALDEFTQLMALPRAPPAG